MNGRFSMSMLYPGTTNPVFVNASQDSLVCSVKSKPLDAGDRRTTKYVYQIFSEVKDRSPTLELLVYGKTTSEGPETLLGEFSLAESDEVKKRLKGAKYLVLEIRDLLVTSHWLVSRLHMLGAGGGLRR